MTRGQYLTALLRLYLEQPDTPASARRSDWAVASHFYSQGVPFDAVAYAIRLATLRRLLRDPDAEPLQPIRSLAYYRQVLNALSPEELDPGYVAYVNHKYDRLLKAPISPSPELSKPRPHRQNPALCDRR